MLINKTSISSSEGTSFQLFINGILVQKILRIDRRKDAWAQAGKDSCCRNRGKS